MKIVNGKMQSTWCLSKSYLRLFMFISLSLMSFMSEADSPSFNCKNASSSTDQIICNDRTLSYLDKQMSGFYQKAKNRLPQKEQKELLNDQRLWLKNRSLDCKIPAKINFNQDNWDKYSDCLRAYYKKRNYALFKKAFKLENQPVVTNIKKKINFAPFSVIGPISKEEIQQLYNIKITSHGYTSLEDKRTIYTCEDFNKYSISFDDSERRSLNKILITCRILNQLKNINEPNLNQIQNIHLFDIKYIPLSFLPVMVYDENNLINSYKKQGLTVKDLIKKGLVKIVKNSPTSITIHFDGSSEYIDEIARGDFTGDGVNAILVDVFTQSDIGTAFNYNLAIIMFDAKNKLFKFQWQENLISH